VRTTEGYAKQTKRRYARLVSRRSFFGAGVAAIGATAAIGIPAGCQGQFYPGTTVLQLDLSGKTQGAAERLLRQHLAPFEQRAITFEHNGMRWNASLADLGFAVDYKATLLGAFQRGRDDGLLGRYAIWFDGGSSREVFPVHFTEHAATLASYLATLGKDVAVPATNATLVQDGATLSVIEDVAGSRLDTDRLRPEVVSAVHAARPATLDLPMTPVPARITAKKLASVRDAAAALLEGPVTIVAGDASWAIEPETLANALVIPDDTSSASPSLDPALLTDAVTEIASSLYVSPVNAVVGWDNGPYAIEKGQYGRWVDAKELAKAVAEAATREDRTAQVPFAPIAPDVHSDNLDTLGLAGLMAAGDSSFEGSSPERAENVEVAAKHISATLIPPGAQFSFNDSLGPISVENGYVEGKIIQGDWYASDLGGGVCQVSTTVYRAALKAGMTFDEWHPHSFRVSFYELDGWPPGIDAAIYQPNSPDEWEMDLKFTNPTNGWMLLQMVEDSGHVTAQLYGTPLGYDIELDTPVVSDPIPPPEPKERTTTKLPAGQRQEIQVAAPGYNVTLTRSFLKNGKVVDQDTFVSQYQPQPEIWEVGIATGSEQSVGNASD